MESGRLSATEVLQELQKELDDTGVTDETYCPEDQFAYGAFYGINYAIQLIKQNLLPENTVCVDVKCPKCGTVSKVVF